MTTTSDTTANGIIKSEMTEGGMIESGITEAKRQGMIDAVKRSIARYANTIVSEKEFLSGPKLTSQPFIAPQGFSEHIVSSIQIAHRISLKGKI